LKSAIADSGSAASKLVENGGVRWIERCSAAEGLNCLAAIAFALVDFGYEGMDLGGIGIEAGSRIRVLQGLVFVGGIEGEPGLAQAPEPGVGLLIKTRRFLGLIVQFVAPAKMIE